jgi:hypothetical protein
VKMTQEMQLTVHIVTDEDGTLKMKRLETFHDSKVYLELRQQTIGAAAHVNK